MSIKVMSKYQYENKPMKYKYGLYGGIQNKTKELDTLELFCYFKDETSLLKHKDNLINDYKEEKRYKHYKFKIVNL